MEKGYVIEHKQLSDKLYEIEFICPNISFECEPGQFVHIKTGINNEPLLRRPFSLYDVDKQLGSIKLLYRIVGRGTTLMTNIKTKESIDVMGPLGKGFSVPKSPKKVLLVGGGVGIAPLVYLSRVLKKHQCSVIVLHGAGNRRQLVAFDKLREIGAEFMPATDDGSCGFKGPVTELLVKKIDVGQIDYIYTCGPEPMMAAVAEFAEEKGIPGEVSLEEYMACGVGACLGCARKLKAQDPDYKKVCKDGPVFSIKDVELFKN
jgi:dihydroorotate dehydrogenase electron transfer subunit